mmetsp:Transcript_55680/g.119829  ORF Transcript_55680/g.119829 Transcript_55680/m.119829 type:complete len:203 (-) Transcript_55680:175-783(-)
MPASGLIAGDPGAQWEWHEAHRDLTKNQYRTNYTDMTHGREVYVKSDFPAGYGGHIPSIRHDVLFRNTQFDRTATLMRNDPSRDAFTSFDMQIGGLPHSTKKPQGSKTAPSKGVVPHDGTTTMLRPPWGLLRNPNIKPLTQRWQDTSSSSPMRRTSSLPVIGQAAMSPGGRKLENMVNAANAAAQDGYVPDASEVLMEQMQA